MTTPQKALQDVIALGELATPGEWVVDPNGENEHGVAVFVIHAPSASIAYMAEFYGDPHDANLANAAVNWVREHGQHFAGLAEDRDGWKRIAEGAIRDAETAETRFAEMQQELAATREALKAAEGCGACGDACAKRGACRLSEDSPPAGTWLWCQLMDWCRSRRVSPAEYNDLFAIAAKAHEHDATLQRDAAMRQDQGAGDN